jgi:hypothetical protein
VSNSQAISAPAATADQNWQEIVRQHVESLRFGTVEIIIHDSRVIQIEKTERVRLTKGGSAVANS